MSSKNSTKILVVDDEPNVGMIFHRVLGEEGYEVLSAANGNECLRAIKKQDLQVVFLDLRMPGMDGVETLRRLREINAQIPVIIMTAYQTVTSAVETMKLGAFDYLLKPLDTEKLKSLVRQVLEIGEITRKKPALKKAADADALSPQDVVAKGAQMNRVMAMVHKVAPTDMTVLILGESGTGKEVIARSIYRQSARKNGPFVVVDCAALPESLIESELFGYEKGAFTGADATRPGKFESANGGTLFLDEIGNLPLSTQVKLLRFLQEPTIERLGGRKGPITLDVRILAATNAELEKAVKEGAFREDLYHRLKVFLIELPPLRNRGNDDLDELIRITLENFGKQLGKASLVVAPDTLSLLKTYHWPGNIRELQNALRSAALLADDIVLPVHLPISVQSARSPSSERTSDALNAVIERVEKEHISNTLRRFSGDRGKTAEALGLDLETLKSKMKSLGLSDKPEVNS